MPSIDKDRLKYYVFKWSANLLMGISGLLVWVSKQIDKAEIALMTRASRYL
jgi:hypothetical protein